MFVRLSLLTMIKSNQMREILLFVCSKLEQERSEEESSFGVTLALAFRCTRFCSA